MIPRFAEYAAPLYAVSRENKVLKTRELEENFEKLKNLICSTDVLRIPDPEKPFILETDASLIALGAVLKQIENEKEFPFSFFSRALSKTERNYSTYERELYAVVKACESFKIFLLGALFTLRTDHKALASLFHSTLKTSSRVVKWVMRLQEFNFVIEYLAGKENVVADALSRIPWPFQCVDMNDPDSCDDSCDEFLCFAGEMNF